MHDDTRSYWAPVIIICVIVLFGAFWYYERTRQTADEPVIDTAPVSTVSPILATEPGINDLQAAAINTAIPDFSDQF